MNQGYFRFPTVFKNKITFTSEDDLWEVDLDGGVPRRLTAGLGSFSRPQYSPNGDWLAFSSAEEGHLEVFVMPAGGGDIRRLTYLGSQSLVSGWRDNSTILFASLAFESNRVPSICQVDIEGGLVEPLKLGPSVNLAISNKGEVVLERNAYRSDPAHWKRYRGGTAGKLWFASSLDDEFTKLISIDGNVTKPLWIGERIYFISDHEGIGNLYSCRVQGEDFRQETKHGEFYARNPSTDGTTIVYHAGGDVYAFDVATRKSKKVEVDYLSQHTQRQRRFVSAKVNLESASLSPKGDQTALTVRGQVHFMKNWDGPVGSKKQVGSRYRLGSFLADGLRIVAVTDSESGDEHLEIFNTVDLSTVKLEDPNWGRFTRMSVSPKGEKLAFSNHRNELWLVDIEKKSSQRITRCEYKPFSQFCWSPDGRWIAFSLGLAANRTSICVADAATGEFQMVTEPMFEDFAPSFDPEGKYLYFLSQRELNPVYDSLQFELSFPKGVIPCLVTLKKEIFSPFNESWESANSSKDDKKDDKKDDGKKEEISVEIDFEDIKKRILAFPVPEAKYTKIVGIKEKVMLLSFQPEGALCSEWHSRYPAADGRLEVFDFKTQNLESLIEDVTDVSISHDASKMMVRVGNRLRVLNAGAKPEAGAKESAGKKGSWLDFDRVKVLIEPAGEWLQMFHEVWRLQRDHFWREDLSKVNWTGVLKRYEPLVRKINTRSEFADLVWELQGELGTSHAYDIGGDYRTEPTYPVGLLGVDFSFDSKLQGYRVDKMLNSDLWKLSEASPLRAPGVLIEEGDILTEINGTQLSKTLTPHQVLLHQAGADVLLTVVSKKSKVIRKVRVRTLKQEASARYRDWVESNREYVREKTKGRVGYIHIPDMGPKGFAEFHRHFLRDFDSDALIVDVRYNGGGHVSTLLLEKLCRKRMGVSETRWFGRIEFPHESPAGPMVALTNEYAGSDGDIFSHSFKLKKAGPLIGKRTWGGVVGIWPRHRLVDGGLTTQPEFSHWFVDVGWQLENRGAEPDIEVENAPHDYRKGSDPQLDRGIKEVLKLVKKHPPFRPILEDYPDLGFEL